MNVRIMEEKIVKIIMYLSIAIVLGSLLLVFSMVILKGIDFLNFDMITKVPDGGYYLGKGGGILNAIVGSLYLAGGAIILATIVSIPISWYLNQSNKKSKFTEFVRLSLDVSCGIPSLIYGAFVFLFLVSFHQRAALIWGIVTVAIFIIPILVRAMDEIMQTVNRDLKEASYSLGATEFETLKNVITRQAMPGIVGAIILAFGRGIGDAAAVLFTAGYTDNIPNSLFDPVATLPLAIFFQISSPYPEVQGRAYASGIILIIIVLLLIVISRIVSKRLMKYVIR
ncbi:phosphate ABC transporter permease PstA [Methanogenium organophilum]|uniref:Phosphate transport system permease protein PstA n=1 Tax=Methanogenium organophilum TaxID=2199 RepID=A0A9X9S468_METOG|nr:phosphate ABC transporter permease PstA [Methanogenium organophilum]WAI01221.1 phosphate ABC transporter permease PstA [Methanogenium organophilum]